MTTYWTHVTKTDTRARMLADRHYSRQSIGAREIAPPGNSIVLLGANNDALWVSHRPDPLAQLAKRRADGFDYYDNPYFRNESSEIASELIMQALRITAYLWQDYAPADGFHSFVNPRKVKPTKRRGVELYGYCFLKAGFELYPELTKSRKLLRYVFSLAKFHALEPLKPNYEQLDMFEGVA